MTESGSHKPHTDKSKQIETLILIVVAVLVVVGLVVLSIKDANRKSYLEKVRQQNLNAPTSQ